MRAQQPKAARATAIALAVGVLVAGIVLVATPAAAGTDADEQRGE